MAKSVSLYAAAALACVVLFHLLHHIGNGISYELAAQRIAEELAADIPDEGFVEGYRGTGENHEFSLMTLGGADRPGADDGPPLLDAIFPKIADFDNRAAFFSVREVMEAAASGAETLDRAERIRYWWGGKALHAIALRFLPESGIRLLIACLTGASWMALAAVLAATNLRALAVLSPLIVFGALFSWTRFFLNSANGWPYLWAVAAAVVLAWLIRRQTPRRRQAARLFCFAAGMASAYVWILDGHQILAVALIGMLGYFGCGLPSPKERAKFAGACVALYLVGFAASYALGQAIRVIAAAALSDSSVISGWNLVSEKTGGQIDRAAREFSEGLSGGLADYPVVKYFHLFNKVSLGIPGASVVAGVGLALAFLCCALHAQARARRGGTKLRADTLWVAGMAALAALQFLAPEDTILRMSRYSFIFYALCASCAILAVLELNAARGGAGANVAVLPGLRRRLPSAAFLQRAGFGLGAIALAAGIYLFAMPQETTGEEYFADRINAIGDPAVQSVFDVYLDEAKNGLIYYKRNCKNEDVRAQFLMRLYPVNESDLPKGAEREIGRANPSFIFLNEYNVRAGDYCAAKVNLPDYGIVRIKTGQIAAGGEAWAWSAQFRLDWIDDIGDLAVASVFDLHLNQSEGALTYIKEPCSQADADARLFLHITPADADDLPEERREFGFDNLDFHFSEYGKLRAGKCRAQRRLPDYPIAKIKTGQADGDGKIWEEAISLDGAR